MHPKYGDFLYEVDYGYLNNTASMDGVGIDVWKGIDKEQKIGAIMCTVALNIKQSYSNDKIYAIIKQYKEM